MGERPVMRMAKINIAALARQSGPKAIEKLAEALDHEDMRVVIDAASKLLDRGYGKCTQTIERTDRSPDTMTDAELIAEIRAAALRGMDEEGDPSGLLN